MHIRQRLVLIPYPLTQSPQHQQVFLCNFTGTIILRLSFDMARQGEDVKCSDRGEGKYG